MGNTTSANGTSGVLRDAVKNMKSKHKAYRRKRHAPKIDVARLEAKVDTSTGVVCHHLRARDDLIDVPVSLSSSYKHVVRETAGMKPRRKKKALRGAAFVVLGSGLQRVEDMFGS